MISVDPSVRPTFDTLLHTSRGTVFPECFYSFLHNYVSTVNEVNTASVFSPATPSPGIPASVSAYKASNATPPANSALGSDQPSEPFPSDSDHRMERIWADYESVEPYLVNELTEDTVMDVKVDFTPHIASSRPFHVRTLVVCIRMDSYFLLGCPPGRAQYP